MKMLIVTLAAALAMTSHPAAAQTQCPAEVAQAKAALSKSVAKADSVQAPRSLAGVRQNEDGQAPRANQDTQAPRGTQDIQAPRGNQSVQAPRANEGVQSPRGTQDIQAPRGNQNTQAPRDNDKAQAPRANQNVQAPRGNQDIQAPRAEASLADKAQAPRVSAAKLVDEAQALCGSGRYKEAQAKAKEALGILGKQ